MEWWIDIKRKGCELKGCWTHYVTLTFDLTHDHDLIISRSNCILAISQEWEGRSTWNEWNVSRIWWWAHYATLNFDLKQGWGEYQIYEYK